MARICFKTGESSNEKEKEVPVSESMNIDEEMEETSSYPLEITPESSLVQHLRNALSASTRAPSISSIIFQNTEEAANLNGQALKLVNFDWDIFVKKETNTCLHPENEFREMKFIEPLFDLHENGIKLKEIVQEGASYHIDISIEYTEEQADENFYFYIDRGNNKSIEGNEDFIKKTFLTNPVF